RPGGPARVPCTTLFRSVCREIDKQQLALRRPRRVSINLGLTMFMIAAMIWFKIEPVAVFMMGVVLALQINYPDLQMQRERIDAQDRKSTRLNSSHDQST